MSSQNNTGPSVLSDTDWNRLKTYFREGLELNHECRQQLLDHVRRTDSDLVEELVMLWEQSKQESGTLKAVRHMCKSLWEFEMHAPQWIGPYRVLEEIGSGGMASVFKAEQVEPIRRTVAVKLLSLWLCSETYLLQFRREQEAIARMLHPNVAVVFDSGVSAEGQPYFVMEYLDGPPISRYCDEHGLNLYQRLRLFSDVCNGMAHAHRKGVIHLDLKPENVLVIERDGVPVPKIIDFGIARLEDRFAEAETIAAGTLEHMSPEQTELGDCDLLDTRSDIYGLGALLFRILTGVPRLDHALAGAETVKDACRIIRTTDPLSPSQRVALEPAAFTEIARKRGCDPHMLHKALSGELDWIVGRAMAREAESRYETCEALREDLDNYHQKRPLKAAPPGKRYHFFKFVARNKKALITQAVFLALICLALILVTMAWQDEINAKNEARMAEAKANRLYRLNLDMFASFDPFRDGREVKIADLLERTKVHIGKLDGDPDHQAELRQVMGDAYRRLGFFNQARLQYQEVLAFKLQRHAPLSSEVLISRSQLGLVDLRAGLLTQAEQLFQQLFHESTLNLGQDHRTTLSLGGHLAETLTALGRFEEANGIYEQVLPRQTALLVRGDPQLRATRANYAKLLVKQGRYARAETIFRAHLVEGADINDLSYLSATHSLAHVLQEQGRLQEAEPLYRKVLDRREVMLGSDHPDTVMTRLNLAIILGDSHPNDALELLDPICAGPVFQRMETHPVWLLLAQNRGHFLVVSGREVEAESVLRRVLAHQYRILGGDHPDTIMTQATLAQALIGQERLAEAIEILRDVHETATRALGAQHRDTLAYSQLLERCRKDARLNLSLD